MLDTTVSAVNRMLKMWGTHEVKATYVPIKKMVPQVTSLLLFLFCHGVAYREASGLQGYLAHKETPTPLGPPKEARHGLAEVSYGVSVSYERGTPVFYHWFAYREDSPLQGYLAHNKLRPPPRIAPRPQA